MVPRHPGFDAFIGVLGGSAFSAAVWVSLGFLIRLRLFGPIPIDILLLALFVVISVKLIVGVALIRKSVRTHNVGIGVLISIALGSLIFCGMCGII
jgi:hypothetical protein